MHAQMNQKICNSLHLEFLNLGNSYVIMLATYLNIDLKVLYNTDFVIFKTIKIVSRLEFVSSEQIKMFEKRRNQNNNIVH